MGYSKRIFFIFCCNLITTLISAQSDTLYQINLVKGHKQKTIKNFGDVGLFLSNKNQTIFKEFELFFSPKLRLSGDSLQLTVHTLSTEEKTTSGESKITTVEFPMSEPGQVTLHINDIDKLSVGRSGLKITCGLLATLSVLSAIAVAPAMYIGPQFNYTRYRQMVGASLISAATFITLNLTLGNKDYRFKSSSKSESWSIRSIDQVVND